MSALDNGSDEPSGSSARELVGPPICSVNYGEIVDFHLMFN
jgi:hypothetical protein